MSSNSNTNSGNTSVTQQQRRGTHQNAAYSQNPTASTSAGGRKDLTDDYLKKNLKKIIKI